MYGYGVKTIKSAYIRYYLENLVVIEEGKWNKPL